MIDFYDLIFEKYKFLFIIGYWLKQKIEKKILIIFGLFLNFRIWKINRDSKIIKISIANSLILKDLWLAIQIFLPQNK